MWLERPTMQKNITPEYLCNLGLIHFEEREFDESLQHFESALHIYRENRNYKGIVTCLMNIALIFDEKDNFEIALDYLKEALCIISEYLPDSYRRQEVLETYHTVHNNLIRKIEESLLKEMLDNRVNTQELLYFGDVAFQQGRFHEAAYYYHRAEKLGYFLHDAVGLAEVYQHLQKVYKTEEPQPESAPYQSKALKIAQR